jgi:hypothetical protein
MQKAASAPVGANPVSTGTKWRDTFIVVIAPLLVPAVILAFTRYEPNATIIDCVNLSDVAFGFVAVAIAGVARAVTSKAEDWLTFTIAAIIVVALETAIAVRVDTAIEVGNLLQLLTPADKTSVPMMDELLRMADEILRHQATIVHWFAAILFGGALVAASCQLIWREK